MDNDSLESFRADLRNHGIDVSFHFKKFLSHKKELDTLIKRFPESYWNKLIVKKELDMTVIEDIHKAISPETIRDKREYLEKMVYVHKMQTIENFKGMDEILGHIKGINDTRLEELLTDIKVASNAAYDAFSADLKDLKNIQRLMK